MVKALDRTVYVTHLYDFDKTLSESSTPDWYLYARAAQANFSAFVTRDLSQVSQKAEMFMLSRLKSLTVVTWRGGIEDPMGLDPRAALIAKPITRQHGASLQEIGPHGASTPKVQTEH